MELCEAYGLHLDEWQQNVLKGASGEDAFGKWSASRVGLSVPRQSGKTALFEARELAGLLLYGEELIIHSAHLVPTALEAFMRLKSYFENYDDLGKKVKRIREANGEQGIEMMSGQRIKIMARSKGGGRGFSADCLMLDEVQELPELTWAAMLPTISARANPQVWLAGTPPGPEDNGEVFTRIREAALSGRDKRTAWSEWSMDTGDSLDDRKVWAKAIPALGGRIAIQSVEDERNSMGDDQFARERLGHWYDATTDSPIPATSWDGLKISQSEVSDDWQVAAIGLDMNPERTKVTIAIAAYTECGTHVDLAIDAPFSDAGTTALVDWLWERAKRRVPVVVDGFSPAKSLQPHLVKRGMMVRVLDTRELIQACANFYDDVMTNRSISHVGNERLDKSLAGSVKDVMNKAGEWKFNRSDYSVDLGPLIAAVNAHFGSVKFGRRPLSGGSSRSRHAVVL